MNAQLKQEQWAQAAARYKRRTPTRLRNLAEIHKGRVFKLDEPERVAAWLMRRGLTRQEAREVIAARNVDEQAEVLGDEKFRLLERQIGNNDQMGIAFLEAGMRAARAVGRVLVDITFGNPSEFGTGFLVSPTLLLTNHHVLASEVVAANSVVEFGYEVGIDGRLGQGVRFQLQPDKLFFNDSALDYAIVAVQAVNGEGAELRSRGWVPITDKVAKSITGQWVNIVQHPGGGPKQLVLRENQIVDAYPKDDPNYICYLADTEAGSSGSPVFNDRWEVVALHHAGIYKQDAQGRPLTKSGHLWNASMGEAMLNWVANEGVRITKIIEHLKGRSMDGSRTSLLEEAFAVSAPAPLDPGAGIVPQEFPNLATPEMNANTHRAVSIGLPSEPCEIVIRFPGSTPPPVAGGGQASEKPTPKPSPPQGTSEKEEETLAAAKAEFGHQPGVRHVRMGYKFENDWITRKEAIVVTVDQRFSRDELKAKGRGALPAEFHGLPVEVENVSVAELVAETVQGAGLAGRTESLNADFAGLRLESRYKKPPGLKLPRIAKEAMDVTAHASPDAGWPELEAFLKGAKKTLTIAMYDFTAPHILNALIAAGKKAAFKKLRLCIQPGESLGKGVKANDLPDKEVVKKLKTALGKKLEVAWVTVDRKNFEGWVEHDYHIKVAVRDSSDFWLSSGNWQSSNQPFGSPYTEKPWKREWQSQHNREWHVIVENHPALAKTYEDYIDWDFDNNTAPTPEEAIANAQLLPDVDVPEDFLGIEVEEAAKKLEYFKPGKFAGQTTVQPLLTPDNYLKHAIDLVKSAKKQLLIENQSFKPSGDSVKKLLEAVLDRQRHNVDTRIIFRRIGEYRKNLEALQKIGFDMSKVRLQTGCHTKGMIVDGEAVLIGSHNLTNLGVTLNRDASLIFEDGRIAKYFQELFEYDWRNRATASAPQPHFAPEIAAAGSSPKPGFVRLSPKDYVSWI